MSSTSKQFVLIVGASGNTGRGVTKALLEDGNFRVGMLVRASSVESPAIQELVSAGAEVRIGDVTEAPEKLEAALEGVDVLILLIGVWLGQEPILRAAKAVGVGRVIPSDFGPHAPKGIMDMNDTKLDIREYIKELGLPYTFVEAGAWLEVILPPVHATKETLFSPKARIGDGKRKIMFTSIPMISSFMVKIIADEKTLNKTVVTLAGETTVDDLWALAEKITGESFSDYPKISDETIYEQIKNGPVMHRVVGQWQCSVFIRGDNSLEVALGSDVLDARRLFPEVPIISLEEGIKYFYANPPKPLDYEL